jgi:hypothetical protein
MIIMVQNLSSWLKMKLQFDYNVRVDAKKKRVYHSMCHVWFQNRYLVQMLYFKSQNLYFKCNFGI